MNEKISFSFEFGINEIENYVNDDISVLNGTSYEGVLQFKLKPGHKLCILGLADKIKSRCFPLRRSQNLSFDCHGNLDNGAQAGHFIFILAPE